MTNRYAVVRGSVVENVIIWDGVSKYTPPNGTILIANEECGPGWNYNEDENRFFRPQPYPSWTLNRETLDWEPPTPKPNDGGIYVWNEESKSWDPI